MTFAQTSDPRGYAPPIAVFEQDYAALRRRTRITWAVGSFIFVVLFALSSWLGDFFKITQVSLADGSREWRWIIPAGIPRLGEYVAKTLPDLNWATLGADLADWFWRWKIWLRYQTAMLAAPLCASHNWP